MSFVCHLYIRKGTVYVPTVARTEAGYFLDIEPVEAVLLTETEALQQAIKRAVGRGNPVVPTPTRAAFPRPVVLKYAGVRSWAAFERNCTNWTIVSDDDGYQLKRGRKRPDGGWEDDPTYVDMFAADAGIDDIARKITRLVQVAAA